MNDLFSLAGKNILITGAAQGIGYLLATGLGRYGARIIVNDITPERAETAVTKLQQEGIKAIAAPFNVTHKQDIEAAVEHIEKDIGVIDVLINNDGGAAGRKSDQHLFDAKRAGPRHDYAIRRVEGCREDADSRHVRGAGAS